MRTSDASRSTSGASTTSSGTRVEPVGPRVSCGRRRIDGGAGERSARNARPSVTLRRRRYQSTKVRAAGLSSPKNCASIAAPSGSPGASMPFASHACRTAFRRSTSFELGTTISSPLQTTLRAIASSESSSSTRSSGWRLLQSFQIADCPGLAIRNDPSPRTGLRRQQIRWVESRSKI